MPATPVACLARRGRLALPISIITFFIFISVLDWERVSARQSIGTVATVSAASFQPRLAPDALAATFGTNLAVGTQSASSLPLPLDILGTSVTIRESNGNEVPCPLLFVSPGQINHLIPAEISAGEKTITVRSGSGAIVMGKVMIFEVAPVIFSANNNGTGPSAGDAVRTSTNGQQTSVSLSMAGPGGVLVPRPFDLGLESDVVTLVLYLTGLGRLSSTDGNDANGSAENVRVLLGGSVQTPFFAGRQGNFAGLDQINVNLPRALLDPAFAGSKLLTLTVKAIGVAGLDSNPVDVALAPPAGSPPLSVSGFTGPSPALANSELRINGAGISPDVARNQISFGEGSVDVRQGSIVDASGSQLTVLVPFGAASGMLAVNSDGRRWTSEIALPVQTSFSAVLKDTDDQPIPQVNNARVCLLNCVSGNPATTVQTGGWFVLPNIPTGPRIPFIIDPMAQNSPLPFTRTILTAMIANGRDNNLPRDIFLQAVYGPSAQISDAPSIQGDGPASGVNLTIDGINLSVPAGAVTTFPGGLRTGTLTLTPVKNSLTPAPLPPSIFSTAIVQISPLGTRFAPGAKLTFPNRDGLQASDLPRLFKFDLSQGDFVDTGIQVIVSPDTTTIETPAGAITEASIYLIGAPRPSTTLVGRVLDGGRPVRGATIYSRGQQTITDSNGGFALSGVPAGVFADTLPALVARDGADELVSQNAGIQLRASYLRPGGRIDRIQATASNAVVNGVTQVGALALPSATSNRPPVLGVIGYVELLANETRDLRFIAYDLDPGQSISNVSLSGVAFASIVPQVNERVIRLAPSNTQIGTFLLTVTATDTQGGQKQVQVTVVVKAPPPNRPPTITLVCPTPGKDQIVTIDTTLNCNVMATDPDAGQQLTISFAPQPAGATYNPATKIFSWRPMPGQAGVYPIIFTATDNGVPPRSDTDDLIIHVRNPVPFLSSISPSSVLANGTSTSITLFGSGFVPGSDARFNGNPRLTIFVSSSELRMILTGTDTSSPAFVMIDVANPPPGGGISGGLTLLVTGPPGFGSDAESGPTATVPRTTTARPVRQKKKR
jgi:uncharacterized protein (TIGR03437 family)